MTEVEAINLAKAHAAEWEVPWVSEVISEVNRHGWCLDIEWCTLTVDTGNGSAVVSIHGPTGSVNRFEYYPDGENGWLLPLWAAYPDYTSVTIGWRMSYGELYKHRWHSWYASLTEARKAEYRHKFPTPEDKERGWEGFYQILAENG